MTELIRDAFGSDTSANWDGASITITGGTMLMTEDGLALHSTDLPTSTIWCYIEWVSAFASNDGPAIGDASGNGFFQKWTESGGDMVIDRYVEYDTYTTYASNDDAVSNNIGTINTRIGITVDLTNNIMSTWNNPGDTEPVDVDNWASGSDAADDIEDYGVLGQTQDGNRLGIGNWDTGTPIAEITLFVAGNFVSAGGASIMNQIQGANLGADLYNGTLL